MNDQPARVLSRSARGYGRQRSMHRHLREHRKPILGQAGRTAAVSPSHLHEPDERRDEQARMRVRWMRGGNDPKGGHQRFAEKRSGNTSTKIGSGMYSLPTWQMHSALMNLCNMLSIMLPPPGPEPSCHGPHVRGSRTDCPRSILLLPLDSWKHFRALSERSTSVSSPNGCRECGRG